MADGRDDRLGAPRMAEAEGGHSGTAEAKEASPLVVWGGSGLILLALAGVFTLTHGHREHAKEDTRGGAQAVTVAPLESRPFSQKLTLSGEVRPKIDVRVFAPTAGVRILELLVDEGAMVREGAPLARLDSRVAAAQTRAAEAAVAEARAAQVRTEDEWRRAESIRDSGALSSEAIAARKAAADAARARFVAQQAQLSEVQARLEGGFVRAPAAGLVIERTAQPGQLVDGQPLFRIAGGNQLEVGVEIGESDMLVMRPGQLARFQLVDGTEVTGRMRRGPASLDSRTRTGEAVFDLTPNPKVRAGMFLRGDVELPAQNLLATPQAAIVQEGGKAYVFIVADGSVARKTEVTLGPRSADGAIAILNGVPEGASIVTIGAAFLQDGDRITPVVRPAEKDADARAAAIRGRS